MLTHSLHAAVVRGVRRVHTLRQMRRLALASAVALAAAVTAGSSLATERGVDDGCLVVRQGRGKVTVQAKGFVFARFLQGRVWVEDLSPSDGRAPRVFGALKTVTPLSDTKTFYKGENIRLRASGRFRLRMDVVDLDLSLAGTGHAVLSRDDFLDAGDYSADEQSFCEEGFEPMPDLPTRVEIGPDESD